MLTQKLKHSLHTRGIAGTARSAWCNVLDVIGWYLDASFDRRYNVDTSGKVSLSDHKIESPNIQDATWYEPVPTLCFKQIMRQLQINHEDYVFIDYGSGKGRALLFSPQNTHLPKYSGLNSLRNLMKWLFEI